jgi:hypothetical protein
MWHRFRPTAVYYVLRKKPVPAPSGEIEAKPAGASRAAERSPGGR